LIVILSLEVLVLSLTIHFHRDNNVSEITLPMDASASSTAAATVTAATGEQSSSSPIYSVAHLGNSIQYYNDCPRVLEQMLLSTALGRVVDLDCCPEQRNRKHPLVLSESCLRGGATVPSLWEQGNGIANKFASRPESILKGDDGYDIGAPTVSDLLQQSSSSSNRRYWDFIIVNDHTQSPVRSERKEESKTALETHYLPAIAAGMEVSNNRSSSSSSTTTTVVFVQTMAYKTPVINSAELGSFDDFTNSLAKGYDEYVALVEAFAANDRYPNQQLLRATVAPLGRAYQVIRSEHFDLWSNAMYANDDFHPSPHGTWLEACLLHCVVTGGQKFALFDHDGENNNNGENENDDDSMEIWWKQARYLQPPTYPNGDPQEPLRLPTRAEAVLLNDIAYRVYLERVATENGGNKSSRL
jgi:hypothetical protein